MPTSTYKAATYAASGLWMEDSKVKYKPNPKSGKSFHRYAAYEKATTVGEALQFGSLPADLLFDYEHGHLTVTEPLREKPLDLFAVKNFEELTYTDKVLSRYSYLANQSKSGKKDADRIQVLEESIRKQRASMKRLRKFQIASALEIKEVDAISDTNGFWETPLMMARRSLANQQAKEMLEIVEAEKRKLTNFEVLGVLRLWDFRENMTRQNVMKPGQTFVYSDTMGLVADRTGHIVAKEETKRYPQFGQFLSRWLRENIPEDLGADFVFTSININKNYAGRLHRDASNVGPSILKAFGDFTGGALNYFPEDDKSLKLEVLEESHLDKSRKLDVARGLILFDGKRGHWVDDFEGERYSLVFFTCPRYQHATQETRQFLKAAHFPIPDEKKIAKLLTVLRPPRGYGSEGKAAKSKEAVKSIHDEPVLFWAHDSPSRVKEEAKAQQFWKRKGLREPVGQAGDDVSLKIEWEHRAHKKNVLWKENFFVALPGEPKRKDLILPDFKNMVDASNFLNNPESKVPKAVNKEGCCAVWSNRTKVYYLLYKQGYKEAAMATFGLEAELPRPGRPLTTPPRKRKQPGAAGEDASAAKQRRIGSAASKASSKASSAGKSTPSQVRVKPVAAKPAEGAAKRQSLSLDRTAAMKKLSACTGEMHIEFKKDGKTAESHPTSYQQYAAYRKASTLEKALEKGASPGDLVHDLQAGHLTIVDKCPRGRPRKISDTDTSSLSRFEKCLLRWRMILEKA